MTGVWVLLAVTAIALTIGLVMRARDGRFREATGSAEVTGSAESVEVAEMAEMAEVIGDRSGLAAEVAALGETLGERATLVQFSTAFCAPCRSTRRVLAGVADVVPGVRHIEVDAEAHLDLVRRLGVRRTPTVLVVDADGREVRRASGAPPSRASVFATLETIAPGAGIKRADGDSSDSSTAS